MTASPYQDYYDFLAKNVITPFYTIRLNGLNALHLADVLKRKNPYLFKAKNLELPQDLVKSIIDAFLSSQEETMFGNLLEGFAVYVSSRLYKGYKPDGMPSVDLVFDREGRRYIVGIKSGINWGNSDQINAMKNNFKKARENYRSVGYPGEVVAVNGCIYGKDRNPLKNMKRLKGGGVVPEDPDKVYYKYAGQDFWYFISGDDELYREIIKPIDEEAKQKDDAFKAAYNAKVVEMTKDFMDNFVADNAIDWIRFVDYVSRR
jgi:site-specific DNA-methyltransferase (cytosine-N4-specific)